MRRLPADESGKSAPHLEQSNTRISVIFNHTPIAETTNAIRMVNGDEITYYIPPDDVHREYLSAGTRHTFDESIGTAAHFNITVEAETTLNAAWTVEHPAPAFEAIRNYIAFPTDQPELVIDISDR